MPKSAMDIYHMTIKNCEWNNVINAESAHENAALLHAEHAEIVEKWWLSLVDHRSAGAAQEKAESF